MATKKRTSQAKKLEETQKQLVKARSQARNERNKRIEFIAGTKYGLELAREANR